MKKNTTSRLNFHVNKIIDSIQSKSSDWIDSTKYYSSEQLLEVLLTAGLERTSVEDICYSRLDFPSPDTVLKRFKQTYDGFDLESIEDHISNQFHELVVTHPVFKSNNPVKVTLSIDLHDEEYYGEHLVYEDKRYTMFSTQRRRIACDMRLLLLLKQTGDSPIRLQLVLSSITWDRHA
jgi:hypothetical protein